jgi:phospholipase C
MMQENCSFDHYFGSLQGVRGFGDRTAISRPNGNSVFKQANGSSTQYPWQLTKTAIIGETGGQCNGSLDHSWRRSTRRSTTARWTPGSRPRAPTGRWADRVAGAAGASLG